MKPFTEQEMIRVAKAARPTENVIKYHLGHTISRVRTDGGVAIEYDIEDGNFSMYHWKGYFYPCFPIQAVSDTIREILKERGDDNTSN